MKNKITEHFIQTMLKGLFGLLPIVIIVALMLWLYGKIDFLVAWGFNSIGFSPEKHELIWFIVGISIFMMLLYLMGHLMNTKLLNILELLLKKIPGYGTIKEIVNIFNSSQDGGNTTLVVAIKGFGSSGYNIGLMYSQKESILKDHYTVTLSMSPIPNGGFMFEIHKDNIFVIENASFDDNLQYLLSMGVKSFREVINSPAKTTQELMCLSDWLKVNR